MKVLQLCNKPPYPPVDGGSIAMNSITQGLLSLGCQVKVLSAYSYKHPILSSAISEDYTNKTHFEAVCFDLKARPLKALECLLSGRSYHIERFINKEFEERLIATLKDSSFDIVHLESLFLTPYVKIIRKYSDAKIVLRSHNVEHLIWQQIAKRCKNPIKRWYLKHLSLTLKVYELEHLNDYDGIAAISGKDADFFKQNGLKKPKITIPLGITPQLSTDEPLIEQNSLYHIGAMDWMPNQEGIEWFMEKVWALVAEKLPQTKLYLAGRKMPESFFKYNTLYSNVSVEGEIDDISNFVKTKQINIVPLLSGSGIRVKIIEAMSLGKVVITTTIGAEGINYKDGVHLLIADAPEKFVEQIEKCINEKNLCCEIGNNARQLIADEYDNEKLTQKLIDFYKRI
ncbi:glycosyltransferase family 4 protein [Bacteroidales bacterium OttesenSCG-928-C19]|nr:glycosyltransferase family 4 protein [Bacteroidales bacterium OttesenSCG-928-C19]